MPHNIAEIKLQGFPTDQAAFEEAKSRARSDGQPIYFPMGHYYIGSPAWTDPSGPLNDSTVAAGNLESNLTIYGDGAYQTIIHQADNYLFFANSGSSDPTQNLQNITIRDLALYGDVSVTGFSEHSHLIAVRGVTGLKITNVQFHGFRGDGLFFGGPVQSSVFHNFDAKITACRFDGDTSQNRNGVSFLDCTDWTITGCVFINIGIPGYSPGAIDIEPEYAHNTNKNGTISACYFEKINGFAFAMLLRVVNDPTTNMKLLNCKVDTADGLLAVKYPAELPPSHEVVAQGNYCENLGRWPLLFKGVNNVFVRDNTLIKGDMTLIEPGVTTQNLIITNNTFDQCGNVNGTVIAQDGPINNVQISGNRFTNCGKACFPVKDLYSVRQNGAHSNGLQITNNTVTSPNLSHLTRVTAAVPPTIVNLTVSGNVENPPLQRGF